MKKIPQSSTCKGLPVEKTFFFFFNDRLLGFLDGGQSIEIINHGIVYDLNHYLSRGVVLIMSSSTDPPELESVSGFENW